MEQFDDGNAMKRMADLSQQDYINVINQMNQTLMNAWASDQRVESVKVRFVIFIQMTAALYRSELCASDSDFFNEMYPFFACVMKSKLESCNEEVER